MAGEPSRQATISPAIDRITDGFDKVQERLFQGGGGLPPPPKRCRSFALRTVSSACSSIITGCGDVFARDEPGVVTVPALPRSASSRMVPRRRVLPEMIQRHTAFRTPYVEVEKTMPSLASRYPDGPILRAIEDLDVPELSSEKVWHVSTARVVLADYELIQHDFPHLRPASLLSRHYRLIRLTPAARQREIQGIIDDWLLANAAYMSDTQIRQNDVNSDIQVDSGTATGYRPPGYGRALVVPISAATDPRQPKAERQPTIPGLLDIKGAGAGPGREIASDGGNGLEYLACALRDYVVKRAVDAIFERELPTMWTVPVYAVLDLGFDVREGQRGSGPAGMHVRRAHRRVLHVGQAGPVYAKVSMDVEMALRKYGLSTIGTFGRVVIEEVDGKLIAQILRQVETPTAPEQIGLCLRMLGKEHRVVIDRADVQLARGAEWPPATGLMYDFGAVRTRASFSRPVGYLFSMAETTMIWPDDKRFVRPDPVLRLPSETWVASVLMKRCVNLAERYRRNEITRKYLWQELEVPLRQMVNRWQLSEDAGASEPALR